MSASSESSAICELAAAFVRAELAGNDASHDFAHIDRVRKLALALAREENFDESQLEIVELAALLHDIKDWKYSGSETAGVETAVEFLKSQNYDAAKTERVVFVITNIGFKTELGQMKSDSSKPKLEITQELAVVQDADRLDAIGAIGIARCFTFGGAKNRPLYDPEVAPVDQISKEEYMKQSRNTASLNHFYEKLFLLKDLMKTESGRKRAEQRHQFMVEFVERFKNEWEGLA